MSIWASGEPYEAYVGRWSRLVARDFLAWLNLPPGGGWLDVGCGTGALSQTILRDASPTDVIGVDLSGGFVGHARDQVQDERVTFEVADAQALPFESGRFDAVVGGLMLNFIPSPERGLAEMARVARPGGTVAVYVWDYAEGMALMRNFWDAAGALDPAAVELDEGRRFPLCRPEPLERLFLAASLEEVAVRPIDVPTVFHNFDDYWLPFLGAQGPAPSYVMSLEEPERHALRDDVLRRLPVLQDRSIHLTARAWAVRGATGLGA
jgi:SAM-dependent methyltransferase